MSEIRRIGDTSDILGEGPIWDMQEQAFYWVDIRGRTVRRYDWRTRAVQSWTVPEMVGSLALRARGGLLLAMQSCVSFFDPASGRLERVSPNRAREHALNDGRRPPGALLGGSMDDVKREPAGTLYRLDAKRGCVPMVTGIVTPNSLAWSPDSRTMYFSDSRSHLIAAYPFDPATGELGVARVFYRTEPPAIPDGATVDAAGYVWCALYGGGRVVRIAPDGRLDRSIDCRCAAHQPPLPACSMYCW
jgi:sugar lactone lactonase YvrE